MIKQPPDGAPLQVNRSQPLRILLLWKLLGYYDISLCHLHPNSILDISLFINLCEAFIEIAPHFNLFRYFFCLKPFSRSGSPKVVSGVYLQLRDGMVREYK